MTSTARHSFGQSLLLSRRLVHAGVPIMQANMGTINNWDTHNSNFKQIKFHPLSPLDQGVSALLDDLGGSGLLDEMLLVMVGEFGRTPKLGGNVDTPATSQTVAIIGPESSLPCSGGRACVRGGEVIGGSDKILAYPASNPHYPSDLGATICTSPELGRP